MSCGAKSHPGLLSNDAMFTKFQFAGTNTNQLILHYKSLQRLFSCMFEPYMSELCAIIIWICKSHYLPCNRTILQIVKVVASSALQNNHQAFNHLENISNRYFKTQCFQGTNRDKILSQLRYIPHILQFLPISSNFLTKTVPFPSTWRGWSSSMTTEHPFSFSKPENQSLLGHTW